MEQERTQQDSVEKLREMIKGIKVAAFTTRDVEGMLRSRPMMTQEVEFDGDLWFFTDRTTMKTGEIATFPQVCVTYSSGDASRFVSASGRAELVDDREKMREFWSPAHKIWFPEGVDDPRLILIRIEVEKAEYWDAPSNKFVQLVGLVRSAVTGTRPDEMGDNVKLNLGEEGADRPS